MLNSLCNTTDIINSEFVDIKKKLDSKNKDLNEAQNKILKYEITITRLRENNKQLAKEKKELETKLEQNNNLGKNELINKLHTDLQKIDIMINQINKDIKDIKETPKNLYNGMFANLNDQIVILKSEQKDRLIELREMRKELNKVKNINILDELKKYLEDKGYTEQLNNIIKPYYCDFIKEREIVETNLQEEQPNINIINYIGYCMIENGIHYIIFSDGTKQEINNLPIPTYVGEGQFVLVDENYNFRWAYTYIYSNTKYSSSFLFGIVNILDDDVYVDCGNNILNKLNIPPGILLKNKQIIAFDKDNNFVKYYKSLKINADSFIKSIKSKNHKLFFVLKLFPNGLLLRNIETEEEIFKNIDMNNEYIDEQQVICIDSDNKIVQVFSSYKFYTLSSMYKRMSCGVIEIINDSIIAKKLNGESVVVKNIPDTLKLETGQVINIDEYNNFSGIKDDSPAEGKSFTVYKKNRSTKSDKVEIAKKVLIIGKKTYENTYKLTLYKNGYLAEIIDGYESWNKILSASKDVDMVVVVANFCSHDNMWKIKENIKNVPVIYPEYDGANRILEEIEKNFSKEVAISKINNIID